MSDSLPPQPQATTTAATSDPPQPTPTNNSISEPPSFLPPVSPLSFMEAIDPQNAAMYAQTTVAPLPPPTETWPLCAYCGKHGDLSRCSSCRQAYYCNRECQVAHWEVHSIVCHPGPPQPPNLPKHGQAVAPPPPRPPQQQQPPQYRQQYHHQPMTPRRQSSSSTSVSSGGNTTRVGADGREQYYCEECDRFFKNGQALGGHRSRVHSSRRNGGAATCTPVHNGGGGMNMGPNGGGYAQQQQGQYQRPPIYGKVKKVKKVKKTPKVKRNINHVNGAYICPHCGRTFSSGNALGGHISGAHTKKARKLAEQQAMYAQQQRYARPNRPNHM